VGVPGAAAATAIRYRSALYGRLLERHGTVVVLGGVVRLLALGELCVRPSEIETTL
jgi:hypothetical protein